MKSMKLRLMDETSMELVLYLIQISKSERCDIQDVFSYLTDKHRPDVLASFIRLSKSYYHCSCRRLLNLPGNRRTTQRWQRIGRSVGPALIGKAGKKKHHIDPTNNRQGLFLVMVRLVYYSLKCH
jgi:hypothetical protein